MDPYSVRLQFRVEVSDLLQIHERRAADLSACVHVPALAGKEVDHIPVGRCPCPLLGSVPNGQPPAEVVGQQAQLRLCVRALGQIPGIVWAAWFLLCGHESPRPSSGVSSIVEQADDRTAGCRLCRAARSVGLHCLRSAKADGVDARWPWPCGSLRPGARWPMPAGRPLTPGRRRGRRRCPNGERPGSRRAWYAHSADPSASSARRTQSWASVSGGGSCASGRCSIRRRTSASTAVTSVRAAWCSRPSRSASHSPRAAVAAFSLDCRSLLRAAILVACSVDSRPGLD